MDVRAKMFAGVALFPRRWPRAASCGAAEAITSTEWPYRDARQRNEVMRGGQPTSGKAGMTGDMASVTWDMRGMVVAVTGGDALLYYAAAVGSPYFNLDEEVRPEGGMPFYAITLRCEVAEEFVE